MTDAAGRDNARVEASEVQRIAHSAAASISQDGADFGELMSLRRKIYTNTEKGHVLIDENRIQSLINGLEQIRSTDLSNRDDDLDYLRIAISTEIQNLIKLLRAQGDLARQNKLKETKGEKQRSEASDEPGNRGEPSSDHNGAEPARSNQLGLGQEEEALTTRNYADEERSRSEQQNSRRVNGDQAVPYNQPSPDQGNEQCNYYGGGYDEVDYPDVLLDIPNVSVDEISLDVSNIRAHVSLDAQVASLVNITAGVDASIDDVNLRICGVRASALLIVRLHNVRDILESALSAIVENPMLINRLLDTVDNTVSTVGGVANRVVQPGGVLSRAVDSLGRTVVQTVDKAGNIVEHVVASGDD
jgi:DNA-binding PadR family transcriptional regulator